MIESQSLHIYVDVDDTFVRSAGGKRIPVPSVVQHVRDLHAQGATLYCWSAGGADYARRSAEEFGILACFTVFLPKPNIFLDDQPPAAWPKSMIIHPATCRDHTLEEYRAKLG